MYLRSALFASGLLASFASALPKSPMPRGSGGGRLTIYWGAEDDSTTLQDVCNDDSYGIVVLAFVNKFFAAGGYPEMTISGLWSSTQAQQDAGATGLKDGSSIVDTIKSCQSKGKPVMISLGGYGASVELESDEQGEQVADTLWNLFGGGTDDAELRPFGDVKLDGFDFDNESHNPTGYTAMAKRFRSNFDQDGSKKYYLTAAPQCPYPDASMPLEMCQQCDYVWVQFYNNGNCNIAQSGFSDAVNNWSGGIGDAQLFIGALASDADGDSGYVDSGTLVNALHEVQGMGLSNYGGGMLWEAQLAVQNGNYQQAISAAV